MAFWRKKSGRPPAPDDPGAEASLPSYEDPPTRFLSGDPLTDRRQVKVLLDAIARVSESRDIESLLEHVVDSAVETTGAERGFLVLVGEDGEQTVRVARARDAASGAAASLDPTLEEAAELAGAGPAARLARISAPALLPSLAGGWVMVFVLAMRELDAAILVPAANRTAMFRMFNAVHFGRDDFVAALALLIVFATVVPGLLWTLLLGRRLEVMP